MLIIQANGCVYHGNEHWEFDENGLMRIRDDLANDYLSKNQNVAIANLLRKKGENNNPVAVYKYENNELPTYSAIYTHLVCSLT